MHVTFWPSNYSKAVQNMNQKNSFEMSYLWRRLEVETLTDLDERFWSSLWYNRLEIEWWDRDSNG